MTVSLGRPTPRAALVFLLVASSTSAALNDCQRSIVEQLTNVYESSNLWFPFDSCENINDGRGYTAGIVGFTTGTHDAYGVINSYYNKQNHGNEFDPYMDRLRQLNASDSNAGSTSGLDGFCQAWYAACNNTAFLQAQVEFATQTYYLPSQNYADNLGLTSAVGRGQMYDAAIQHGIGSDPDSLNSLIARTQAAMTSNNQPPSPSQGASEQDWMNQFFQIRITDLCNPSDKSTKKAWCQSTSRVKSYQYLASQSFNFTGSEDSVSALDNDGKPLKVACNLLLNSTYIPGPYPGSGGMSKGTIAGIVIGVILVLILLGVIGYLVWRRWNRKGYRSGNVY
ncbi:hypothetical protein HDV00_007860 [Rhizophlyctis rosea]|nr:hypothetical protein HDV00_007860 [Rhizophlyctis rosea]